MPRLKVRLAESRLYTVRDTAAFFSMSTRWVRERIKARDLDAFACGNVLVSGQSINKFLASRAMPGVGEVPGDEPAVTDANNASAA